jgi:hypothetical protein
MAQYFTKETDKYIAKFLDSKEEQEKHQIFTDQIRPAFEKLIENLIFVYAFYNIDDVDTLKRDGLANLYEMIPKYDPNRGHKAFSYFNVVAKNWFIHKTRERNKKHRLESELYYDLDHELAKNDPSFSTTPHQDLLEEKEFWMNLYSEMDFWRSKLTKKTEKQVLEAVIFLMKNPDLVTIYNKKAVYLYLRELTGLNTKQVVVNLKKIKGLYTKWKDIFFTEGESER